MTTLLAVPNVSEGRDAAAIAAIAAAFDAGLLAVHSDPDHHRSVFTLAGVPGELAQAVLDGARAAVQRIDLRRHEGIHPRVGAIDVAPIVYRGDADRGAACAEALVLADRLGAELGLPVLLYGELGAGRTRAQLRRGGPAALAARIADGELAPDFGPRTLDPRTGAVLVAARPPLVAFNVELAPPATLRQAREIAALVREGGRRRPSGRAGARPMARAPWRGPGVNQCRGSSGHLAGHARGRDRPPRAPTGRGIGRPGARGRLRRVSRGSRGAGARHNRAGAGG